ncbi:Chaperone protein DnaJ [Quillaja saponaria]|uniref:Chaperone protein DnaJ n=1 Tax=Quillaja saponaria TaxID=32244 RepID=A0AAD7Q5H1_QUISA|nr:Chaperone protein DnaJ [Quillaja saponaria]
MKRSGGVSGVDPFEVFDTFFGGSDGLFGGRDGLGGINFNLRNKGNRGLDIRYDLYLNFEESIFGGQREIEVSYLDTCENCDGTGAKSSSCIKSCTNCGGRGGEMRSQRTPFGIMSQVSTCSKCGGDGNIITDRCRRCGGSGQVQSKRKIEVVIPPGINNGATVQIQGEGSLDKKRGMIGDLFVVLHVNEKCGIRKDGLHLFSKVNIDFTEAILGTVRKVETVEGLRDLQIPSGIQPGDSVKLSQLGVPDMNKPSVRGDHHFIVNVIIPKNISDTERILVEELASLRASSKENSFSGNGIGTSEDKFDENRSRDFKNHSSRTGIKHGSSLWSSVKNFLRGRQSKEKFSSISLDASSSMWRFHKPNSSLTISFFTVFIITYVFTLIRKFSYCTLIRQRNHPPIAHRTLKDKHQKPSFDH